jgi:hypothetical protein
MSEGGTTAELKQELQLGVRTGGRYHKIQRDSLEHSGADKDNLTKY